MFEGFEEFDLEANGVTIHGVKGGSGPPLLLLHGYPQTHVMWHKIASALVEHFTVIATDLRGYGDSDKPVSSPNHDTYSFRALAADQVSVMSQLGFERFRVCGHDRGARVTHRMALDHPDRIERLAMLDIVPTLHVYETINQQVASGYYHWFFLIQPEDLPERLIGSDPEYYLRKKTAQWSRVQDCFDNRALAEYIRCFSKPETIHATCEDYRAGAGIDLDHDRADRNRKVAAPAFVLWGGRGLVGKAYDVLSVWREYCDDVHGEALDCGHFLPEEAPDATLSRLLTFIKD